tara:strand:- start:22574 stop:23449 length:876 start_codon:yes stop_codon:yes gene_type:complete
MRSVHVRDLPLQKRTPVGRGGTNQAFMLMNPDLENDGVGAFGLRVIHQDESFYSPRHHHAFDQFRYMLEGESDETVDGKLAEGILGYFPEGAYYGPESGSPRKMILMQFGSPSGFGLLSRDQISRATKALSEIGTFENGVYRSNQDRDGKRTQDGFEAAWEYIHQKDVEYPRPQYTRPILIDTKAFPWIPVPGNGGVYEKSLGTFSSTKVQAAIFRVDSGSKLNCTGRGVYVVLMGKGEMHNEAYEKFSALYLDEGEACSIVANETTEVIFLGLPVLNLIGCKSNQPAERM